MKTLNRNLIVSALTMFGIAFLMLAAAPIATGSPTVNPTFDFEIGTQFGMSHLMPDSEDSSTASITFTRLPSGTFVDIGSSPTSLCATVFFGKHFAMGSEFGFGRISVSDESWDGEDTGSITTLHLAGRATYFPFRHFVSSPYVFGRITRTIFSGEDILFFDADDLFLASLGGGFGYQWRIGDAFVLRTEAQYQRVFDDDTIDADGNAHEFSFIIGIGTRFGNNDTP